MEIVGSLKLINARNSIKMNINSIQIYRAEVFKYANRKGWDKAGKAW